MPQIAAACVAYPPHYYAQDELASVLLTGELEGKFSRERVARIFDSVSVGGRHLALPLEKYAELGGFGERNDAWLECALEVGERAVAGVLDRAGMKPGDIRLFVSSTVTGIAVPSLEARLMNRLAFAPDCRRMPLFGLGCVAGAAGVARVAEYLRGEPEGAALLLCVELCSLTFQPNDGSMANIVASGLFGDGAGCALLVGDDHPLARSKMPKVDRTRSVFFPDTERTMGWDLVDTGFQIVLSAGVPEFARTTLATSIRDFLAEEGLAPSDIDVWIAHPGGPAVIDAMEKGLELDSGALSMSRDCLERVGNLSSVSVLAILEEILQKQEPGPGTDGLLLAMGPGFCAELVSLEW